MKVIIIEDENLTAKRLGDLIRRYDSAIQVAAHLPSVKKAVQWLQQHPQPDLVFMDIHLEDDLAFRIFERTVLTAPVIFTTAYDEYMIEAFKVNSVHYLLKPINYEELVAAMEKYNSLKKHFSQPNLDNLLSLIGKAREADYKERFMITVGAKIRSIETKDIAYFYVEEKVSLVVTKDGLKLPVDYSLDKLMQVLDPKHFFRVNRQHVVSLQAIHNIYTYSAGKLKLELVPPLKHEVFVSTDRITDFKEWLGK